MWGPGGPVRVAMLSAGYVIRARKNHFFDPVKIRCLKHVIGAPSTFGLTTSSQVGGLAEMIFRRKMDLFEPLDRGPFTRSWQIFHTARFGREIRVRIAYTKPKRGCSAREIESPFNLFIFANAVKGVLAMTAQGMKRKPLDRDQFVIPYFSRLIGEFTLRTNTRIGAWRLSSLGRCSRVRTGRCIYHHQITLIG